MSSSRETRDIIVGGSYRHCGRPGARPHTVGDLWFKGTSTTIRQQGMVVSQRVFGVVFVEISCYLLTKSNKVGQRKIKIWRRIEHDWFGECVNVIT